MRLLFAVLPLAGCAAMSLLCRRMSRRGQCASPADDEVAALRAEVAELRARSVPAREPEVRR